MQISVFLLAVGP